MRKRREKIKGLNLLGSILLKASEHTETPPGIDIPYPNIGSAKDTTSGSKKVKIGGTEVGLNKSIFNKSQGDEPGTTRTGTLRKLITKKKISARKKSKRRT